jgi:hypothetical protein
MLLNKFSKSSKILSFNGNYIKSHQPCHVDDDDDGHTVGAPNPGNFPPLDTADGSRRFY